MAAEIHGCYRRSKTYFTNISRGGYGDTHGERPLVDGHSVDADRFGDYEVKDMTETNINVSTTSTDALAETTPQRSPDELLLEAELKAAELSRLRQILMREKRQQLRKVGKQNLKSKNRRREFLARRSRKRNR